VVIYILDIYLGYILGYNSFKVEDKHYLFA
jgi:hypothetical protein